MSAASAIAEAVDLTPHCMPFLKWAGGKRWLFRRHRQLFPAEPTRLIDPFLGGGSSFFFLKPQSAILADANIDLISTYEVVRDQPRELAELLKTYHNNHSPSAYYDIRSSRPTEKLPLAAWLLYLNCTCWNGLYRVNLKGEFNVPIGTKTKVFLSEDEFDAASVALKSANRRESFTLADAYAFEARLAAPISATTTCGRRYASSCRSCATAAGSSFWGRGGIGCGLLPSDHVPLPALPGGRRDPGRKRLRERWRGRCNRGRCKIEPRRSQRCAELARFLCGLCGSFSCLRRAHGLRGSCPRNRLLPGSRRSPG